MGNKTDTVQKFLWNAQKRLEFARSRLEANPGPTKRREAGSPMTEEEGLTWWKQYTELKTIETIAEQDIAWCRKYLGMEEKDERSNA